MSRSERGAARRSAVAVLRWWPPVVYPLALCAASLVVQGRPDEIRAADVAWVSTNLDNLADHPVRSLLLSGFLAEEDVLAWTVLAALGLAGLVAAAGPLRAVVAALAAHLIGTAVSEGSLAVRIGRGLAPVSQRTIVDVGPSFVVVGALVAAVICGRTLWWRLAALAGFALLVPSLFDGLLAWDVAAVGHVTAIVVALVCGGWILRERRSGSRRPVPAD